MQHIAHEYSGQGTEGAHRECAGRDGENYKTDHRMSQNEAGTREQIFQHRVDMPVRMGRPCRNSHGGDHQSGEHEAGAVEIVADARSSPAGQSAGNGGARDLQHLLENVLSAKKTM